MEKDEIKIGEKQILNVINQHFVTITINLNLKPTKSSVDNNSNWYSYIVLILSYLLKKIFEKGNLKPL